MNRAQIITAGGAIALMIGATAALSNSNQNSGSSSALAVQSISMLPAPSPIAPSPVQQPASSPVPSPLTQFSPAPAPSPTYYSQQIRTCAGNESNANFRAYPSLDSRSVLGSLTMGKLSASQDEQFRVMGFFGMRRSLRRSPPVPTPAHKIDWSRIRSAGLPRAL